MPHTVWVQARDFFLVDQEATVEINGGHPAIYVLDDEFLSDLRSGPVSYVNDVSAAEGLCDLLEDELLGYVSSGRPSLSDREVTQVSRTLEAVTRRLGIPADLPFRNFTTLDVHTGRFPSSRTTSIQSYRQLVLDFFKPLRSQLAEMEGAAILRSKRGSMPTSVILLRSESTSLDSREPLAALTSRARISRADRRSRSGRDARRDPARHPRPPGSELKRQR